VSNLRGKASALNINSEAGRRNVGQFLRDAEAEIVILDPLAPLLAALGLDENSNSDVARFFAWWSETMQLGGVVDDLVVHHSGHNQERSRGASRLNDEPDAVWTLSKDQDSDGEDDLGDMFAVSANRFLQAFGRDVELPAELLDFDPETKLLTLTGVPKSRAKARARQENRLQDAVARVRDLMSDGQSRTKTEIVEAAKLKGTKKAQLEMIDVLIDGGFLRSTGNLKRGQFELLEWNFGKGTE
jgi:AAA domain